MKVSEVGFGAWAIGGNQHGNSYGPTDDRSSLEAIARAIDAGCNFFDTADVYGLGHSEEILGRALKSHRDKVLIASKVGADFYRGVGRQNFSDEYVRFALEKSLERLRTDYLDVLQLHNPALGLIEQPETYAVLNELKREGKIRAWGVSIFDPIEGLAALRVGRPDCLQVVYNLFAMKPADELFPRAQQSGCAIICREPLANGFLTGKYTPDSEFAPGDIRHDWPKSHVSARIMAAEKLKAAFKGISTNLTQIALKFALAPQAVSVVIPGIKTADQAAENLAVSDLPPLSAAQMAKLHELQKGNFGLVH